MLKQIDVFHFHVFLQIKACTINGRQKHKTLQNWLKVECDPCLIHVMQLVVQIEDLKHLHLINVTEYFLDLPIKVYLKYLKVYFLFHCFISDKRSKDPNHLDYVPSVYSFRKNTGKKKGNLFNRFECFTKRQARSPDSVDKNNPEIPESTQLKDLLREDKSTNWHCIILIENFMKTDVPILPKESFTNMYKDIRNNENLRNLYTGLPNTCLFNYVLEIIKQRNPCKCKILT